MSPDQTKRARYLELLDLARCNGDWASVPELVRKVRKHAPDRSCLALTAESEYALSKNVGSKRIAKDDQLQMRSLVAPLTEAIDKEKSYVEDEFQARVCLAWIYWVLGDLDCVISRLPENIESEFAQFDGNATKMSKYTQVSALKATYLKGAALSRTGAAEQALEVFTSAMPILSRIKLGTENERELREWTERYLTQFCMLSSQIVRLELSSTLETETLTAFRAWARFWDAQSGNVTHVPVGGHVSEIDIPRRRVWKEYYLVLSTILQEDLPYSTTPIAATHADTSTRLLQRAELQRIETRYESLMLKETTFPRADQASEEVEEWVELVMGNWRILCGNSWREEDLGQGGKEAVNRSVLGMLYRAATKTFHSTTILRHLFTIHMAVAEFDLAFKAFDTYLDIVKRGKARVEKSGEPEHGLDSDEVVLVTVSECIKGLCRYGSYHAAEKAKDVATFLVGWLKNHNVQYHSSVSMNDGFLPTGNAKATHVQSIAPEILSTAWRSIGISQANLARLTHDAEARSDLQQQALKSFREALSREYKNTTNIDSLFALAVVLAERREIASAIEVVKAALQPTSTTDMAQKASQFARERSLIPLWHLLALLLSARQDFTTALRACDAAFEQFHDEENLFGQSNAHGAYRSEHLNRTGMQDTEEDTMKRQTGVVHNMDDTEKENMLEIKMTQLVLIEILEGPEVAVNASEALFNFYTKLFGNPQSMSHIGSLKVATPMPHSASGTLKSIKGSIFGRSRRSVRKSHGAHGSATVTDEKSDHISRPETSQTVVTTVNRAPTIQVTNDNGTERNLVSRGKSRNRSSHLIKKKSQSSDPSHNGGGELVPQTSALVPEELHEQAPEISLAEYLQSPSPYSTTEIKSEYADHGLSTVRSSQVGLAISPEDSNAKVLSAQETDNQSSSQPLPDMPQNLPQIERALQPSATSNGRQDIRLPLATSPTAVINSFSVLFSKEQLQWNRSALLIKVWLLVSGFYRRAAMYNDATDAIDEAEKLVERLETHVFNDSFGSPWMDSSGWGHGKSLEQLRGDISSERGYLSMAKNAPYTALSEFETALVHFPDHPAAIVGLSNILLDVYTEALLPEPSIPSLLLPGHDAMPSSSTLNAAAYLPDTTQGVVSGVTLHPPVSNPEFGPLGLQPTSHKPRPDPFSRHPSTSSLEPPHKATSTALLDRLAARDRAYGLLSALTKLGVGWNYSEAWLALARTYEAGGQIEKAKEVLWWCVELEESKGVRDWTSVAVGGYVL